MSTPPMARGDNPVYPLAAKPRWSARSFGSPRPYPNGPRAHAGVDLKAKRYTPVVATEPGTVIYASPKFYKGTGIIMERTDSGITVVYGEVEPTSLEVARGDRVERGERIAAVGKFDMLHFETRDGTFKRYIKGFSPERPGSAWWRGHPPPANLLDPRDYLRDMLRAEPQVKPVPDKPPPEEPPAPPLPPSLKPTWPGLPDLPGFDLPDWPDWFHQDSPPAAPVQPQSPSLPAPSLPAPSRPRPSLPAPSRPSRPSRPPPMHPAEPMPGPGLRSSGPGFAAIAVPVALFLLFSGGGDW